MPRTAAESRRRTELADRRRRLGHTQESLGEKVGVSADSIAGWERGSWEPLPRYRPRLAAALGLDLVELDRLIDPDAAPIVLNGHRVPTWLNHYESLIEAAGWLGEVEAVAIPGLLQTRAYAEELECGTELLLTAEQVRERVELRLARQRALERQIDPLHLTALLAEHVLRAEIGGPQVMGEQLDHLAALQERPNVELLVLPANARSTSMVNGFLLLTKPAAHEPFMAVTLDVGGARYHEDPDLVTKFVSRFDHLTKTALSPPESARHIQNLRENIR
jgi:transcriptional regulator with XRE-family HTH domain